MGPPPPPTGPHYSQYIPAAQKRAEHQAGQKNAEPKAERGKSGWFPDIHYNIYIREREKRKAGHFSGIYDRYQGLAYNGNLNISLGFVM